MRLIKFTWDTKKVEIIDVEVHVWRKKSKPSGITGATAKSRATVAPKGARPVDIKFGFTAPPKGDSG